MPCAGITAWYSKDVNPTGKRSLVFDKRKAYEPDNEITIACGRCLSCRLKRSVHWAIRCVHEAQMWEENCFVTLTYNKENVPRIHDDLGETEHLTLDHRDVQLFMKRLRKKFGKGVRYFMCGEYGPKFSRPHYHICMFNIKFNDKYEWETSENGDIYYRSETLEKLWDKGFSTIGELNFNTAAYVARYITKKQLGKNSKEHYEIKRKDGETIAERKPEYCVPSRRPGIASGWLEKYHADVYPKDHCVFKGKKKTPPKFYDKWYDKYYNDEFATVKMLREQKRKLHKILDMTEILQQNKMVERRQSKINRSYENK